MKYLITESKINSLIENFLKKQFDIVIDVKFKKIKVYLGSGENRTIERIEIQILIDPYGILKGNFEPVTHNKYLGDIEREISNSLENFFYLEHMKYGSNWGIEFFVLKTY